MFYSGHPLARAYWRVFEVPVLGRLRARLFILGAPVGPRPLEDLEVPFFAASAHVILFQGHPSARNHWSTSRCPFLAAYAHVV